MAPPFSALCGYKEPPTAIHGYEPRRALANRVDQLPAPVALVYAASAEQVAYRVVAVNRGDPVRISVDLEKVPLRVDVAQALTSAFDPDDVLVGVCNHLLASLPEVMEPALERFTVAKVLNADAVPGQVVLGLLNGDEVVERASYDNAVVDFGPPADADLTDAVDKGYETCVLYGTPPWAIICSRPCPMGNGTTFGLSPPPMRLSLTGVSAKLPSSGARSLPAPDARRHYSKSRQ